MQIYRLDCINQICKKICSENMQKYADLYVKYAEVYLLHILHLYALPTLLMTLAQWEVKLSVLSESYRAHRLSADRVLEDHDGNFSRYCFLLPSESNVAGPRVVNEFTFSGMKVRL